MIGVLLQAKAFCDVFCRLFRFTKDLEMSEKNCCGGCDPERKIEYLQPGMVVTLLPGETLSQISDPVVGDQEAKAERGSARDESPDHSKDSEDQQNEASE
jgi:hypothetical protein